MSLLFMVLVESLGEVVVASSFSFSPLPQETHIHNILVYTVQKVENTICKWQLSYRTTVRYHICATRENLLQFFIYFVSVVQLMFCIFC